MGVQSRWISLTTGPAKNPFATLDRALGTRGYRRLSELDDGLTPGVQKVVAYGYVGRTGAVRAVKHVALQAADGTWTSKLGHLALIRHPRVESLSGPSYGRPIAIYARAV
jgi:type VI secretion system secreted protein VgrG